MSKKWFLILPLIVVAFLLFQNLLVFKFVEWSLKSSFQTEFQGDLKWTSLEREGSTLVLNDVEVIRKDSEAVPFSSKKMTLHWNLSFLKRTLFLDFEWFEPHVRLEHCDLDLLKPRDDHLAKFIKIDGSLKIFQGKFYLPCGPANLDMDLSWGVEKKLELTFQQNKSFFNLSMQKNDDEHEIRLKAEQFSLPMLSELLENLAPNVDLGQIQSGILQGTFAFRNSKYLRPQFQGNLTLQDFSAKGERIGYSFKAQEILLELNPVQAQKKEIFFPWIPALKGKISFSKPGEIAWGKDERRPVKVKELTGNLIFKEVSKVTGNLRGIENYEGFMAPFNMGISLDYETLENALLSIAYTSQNPDKTPASLELRGFDLGGLRSQFLMDLGNIGAQQFTLLTSTLQKLSPGINPIEFKQGQVSAKLQANLKNHQLSDLSISDISLKNLSAHAVNWDTDFGAESVCGFIKLDLEKPKPFDTLDAEISITDGFLKLNYLQSELWTFKEIQTKLIVDKGVIQNSIASVNLAGLTGEALMNWHSKETPLRMHFTGTGKDIALFAAAEIKQGVEKFSLNDSIVLDISMSKEASSFRFKGNSNISEPDGGRSQLVNFGFDLTPSSQSFILADNEAPFWMEINEKWLPELFTPYNIGSGFSLMAQRQKDLGILGFKISQGWLSAKNVDLHKFVSPYLFRKNQMQLTGFGDIGALFDLRGIELTYTTNSLSLENEHVLMTMDTPSLKGHHWADFRTGDHMGTLPLKNATYFDKEKSTLFSEVEGEALFHNKKIFLNDLSGNAYGLDMKGSVLIDNSDPRPGMFDVHVHINDLDGTVNAATTLMGRIDPNLTLSEIPLTGRVHLSKEGADLTFNKFPDKTEWDAKIKGLLTEGELPALSQIHPQSISLSFEYDKDGDKLLFSDITGAVTVGEAGKTEPLHFFVDQLGFHKLSTREGNFSFKLWDEKGELLALRGSTEGGDQGITFSFDRKKSHLFGVTPTVIEFETLPKGEVGLFKFDINFSISELFSKLQKFLPDNKKIHSITEDLKSSQGDLSAKFRFYNDERLLNYELTGKNIAYNNKKISKAYLLGTLNDGVWKIKDCLLDTFSFSLDLSKKNNFWAFDHVSLKSGNSLLMGFDGEWQEGEKEVKATVHLMEIDLEHLDEFEDLVPFIKEFNPKGVVKGSGVISISEDQDNEIKVDASLTSTFNEIELKGLSLKGGEPFSLKYTLDKNLMFRNLKCSLVDTFEPCVNLFIDKLDYDIAHKRIEVENINYSLPAERLFWLTETLKKTFPDLITPFLFETISTLKTTGLVNGAIGLTYREDEPIFKASLEDGAWTLLGSNMDIKDFSLTMDKDEVKVATRYQVENELVWVLARSPCPDFLSGVVVIADAREKGAGEQEPVTIYWEKREKDGIVVKKVHGSAFGVHLALVEDTVSPSSLEWLNLQGEAAIDWARCSIIFPEELRLKLQQFGLGEGWGLRGRLQIQKEAARDLVYGPVPFSDCLESNSLPLAPPERAFYYEGELHGDQFDFKGFRFDRLFGTLIASNNGAYIKGLSIEDPSGKILIDEGSFSRDPAGSWVVNVPSIKGFDLRPSKVWETGKPRPSDLKPLLIRNFTINNLYGPLSPLSSLTGDGSFSFVNPIKKNLANTIFAIPGEILSRIGIDLVALSPVTGTILFHIENEKVVFTKFKDVYSDGKLSKFYLASSSSNPPSYMDFDGSLHLQIKMKQYTLLFKLAELFTFSIQGNITKPTYSLKKGS